MKYFLLVIFYFSSHWVIGQSFSYDSSFAKANLNRCAQSMRMCLKNNDFEGFVKYVHPEIIKMAGGPEKMVALTKQSFDQLKKQGLNIKDVTVDTVSTILVFKQYLETVIQENLNIKVNNGHLLSKSYLIGISKDKGKTWTFIDPSGKTLAQMKSVLSFLSGDLIIPQKEQPLFYPD